MSDDQKQSKANRNVQATEVVREPAQDAAAEVWGVSYTDDDDRELTTQQIKQALSKGEIGPRTLVWRPGMAAWRPLETVEELSELLPAGRKAKAESPQKRRRSEGSSDAKQANVEPRRKKTEPKRATNEGSPKRERKQPAPSVRPATAHAVEHQEPASATWLPLFIGVAALFGFWFTRGEPGESHAAEARSSAASAVAHTTEPPLPQHPAATVAHEPAEVSHAAEPHAAEPHAAEPHAAEPHAAEPHAAEPHAEPAAPPSAPTPTASNALAPEPAGTAGGNPPSFDKVTMLRAFARNSTKVARCRSRAEPEGVAHLNLRIEPSGQITEARVLDSAYAGTSTAKCILERVKSVTLPPFSGGAVTLRVPLTLY